MRHKPFIFLLLAVTGCAIDPGPDVAIESAPYGYDTGGYYADPRPVDYDVEVRGYATRDYYYAQPYPYFYGHYSNRRYYNDHRRDGGDRRHDDGNDRERIRNDRSTAPPPLAPEQSDRPRERKSIPSASGRPSQSASEAPPAPSRSGSATNGGASRSSGPRGGSGRR